MSHLPSVYPQSLHTQSLHPQSLHTQSRARPASLSSSSCFMLLAAALGGGCGDAPLGLTTATDVNPATGWNPPALRGSVTLSDTELALDALSVLGSADVGSDGRCSSCHVLGRPTLTRWSALTDAFSQDCLANPTLANATEVGGMRECFGTHAKGPTLSPASFGIYAAAAHLPWFSFVFEHAGDAAGMPTSDWRVEHADFVARVGMPRAGQPLSQQEFDLVAEWFARGLPGLFELVPEDAGEECSAALSPRLTAHVLDMGERGWKAKNEQTPLLMFGCADGATGSECLTDFPLARDEGFSDNWDAPGDAQIRVLYDNSGALSTFWSRASADGRFIGSGLLRRDDSGDSGQFLDLDSGQSIGADFDYDPTFFPDNSGFLIQRGATYFNGVAIGGKRDDVAVVCNQSVLSSDPDRIDGGEEECVELSGQIGLYQQLAKAIDGEDYWVTFGSYDSDNGGFNPVLENPPAPFETASETTLVPMINQGARFEPGPAARVGTPLQGDPMLSPSGQLLVTRVKGREFTREVDGDMVVTAEQSGYAVHRLTTSRDGARSSASIEEVGRICMQGGKAVVSYDERWMVFHHYVVDGDAAQMGYSGPDDPEFEDYLAFGASNLYLVDLLDGSTRAITNMNPGQYAVFPHFRSDGWIYFVVRTLNGAEYFAASDAAVVLEENGD
jgi:hypothetical protein